TGPARRLGKEPGPPVGEPGGARPVRLAAGQPGRRPRRRAAGRHRRPPLRRDRRAAAVGPCGTREEPAVSEPLLEASGITKSFGGVRALRGADFAVHPGEVAALVGDNGAGKSTLVKILSGTLAPDGGEVWFEGRQVTIPTPGAARELGIGALSEDRALAPAVYRGANLFLGRELVRPGLLGRLGFLDKAAMRRRTNKAFADLGVRLQDTRDMVA